MTGGTANETGTMMHKCVDLYYYDMIPYSHYAFTDIFDIIAGVPYNPDPPEAETIQRPYYTMHSLGLGGDCDDKAIAIASWAKIVKCPDPNTGKSYRFLAVRSPNKTQLHHVYAEIFLDGEYIPADCTYSFNNPGIIRGPYAEYRII